jgi:hypothetical protein
LQLGLRTTNILCFEHMFLAKLLQPAGGGGGRKKEKTGPQGFTSRGIRETDVKVDNRNLEVGHGKINENLCKIHSRTSR